MKKLLLLPFTLLAYLFGRVQWSAPPWMVSLSQRRGVAAVYACGLAVLAALMIQGYRYYDGLPKPIQVRAEIPRLQLTDTASGARPDTLRMTFAYDLEQLHQDQVVPTGTPSVARIDLIGQPDIAGISITPVKKGRWSWVNDHVLEFTPEMDWAPGVHYTVALDPSIFSATTHLSQHEYVFNTPALDIALSNLAFYQDPQNVSVRRVVATLGFSHPIDKASVEKHVSLGMRPSGEGLDTPLAPVGFNVQYDKNLREAYVQSDPIALPKQSNYMTLRINKGVESLFGGAPMQHDVLDKVLIPDVYSFLKVENGKLNIVRNTENVPEQVLTLEFTDDIALAEIQRKVKVYLLPAVGETHGRRYWQGPRQVGSDVLENSQRLPLTLVENARDASKVYSISLDVPENRYIYVKASKGMMSVNGFIQRSFYDAVLRSPVYPKEIDIAGDGSILTHSGKQHVSVVSRGLTALKYTVGKVNLSQLNHVVSQTNGDINNPHFRAWNFNEQNLAAFSEHIVDIPSTHPKMENFSSFDLGRYMGDEAPGLGLFFVNVEGWDRQRNRAVGRHSAKRLILITDLGIIVKTNRDNSHEVFVQSIHTGEPVKGASVALLGKNGIPLFTRTLSEEGHASFPITSDYHKEKQPTAYVVTSGNDVSFIPFRRHSRQINVSRFDIGGVRQGYYQKDALNGYLFSDRGIYRPGETVKLGAIVKHQDMSNVEGIPLEWVIRGPRNNEVKVQKLSLPDLGFFDITFPSEVTTETGQYKASLHLVRDNQYRGREIGSTVFSMEEFQPDTMKIASLLEDSHGRKTTPGWFDTKALSANVSLQNLFGIPAQDRKLVGRIIVSPATFRFAQYEAYRFTDPYAGEKTATLRVDEYLPEKQTDADGHATFPLDLSRFRQGTYQLRFEAEGFEQGGGRSVRAANSVLISPLTQLIGHKSDGRLDYIHVDAQRQIDFIAIDSATRAIEATGLTLVLKEIQQVSTLVKQKNGTYQYQTVPKENAISAEIFQLPTQGYAYRLPTHQPGDFVVEISDGNNRVLSRVGFTVVGHSNLAGKIDKNAELSLALDKKDYLPGDWIEMNIKAPYRGKGLITIETDKVHHFQWFSADTESSMHRIRIPDQLEGTAYVSVALVRDIGSEAIYTSPLSYAVQPFSIDKSKRRVDVTLQTPSIVRPGESMTMTYATSRPAKVAIFAVDEGILQVAKYQSPDPLAYFLQKRALEVTTLQILDLILPDITVERRLSASGGGVNVRKALAKNINPFQRATDRPAVFWSGIRQAGLESQSVTFTVPDTFSGTLRVMAVAVAEDAVGVDSQRTLVRGPFVISPNMLTQAAPGDTFDVDIGIANNIEGSGQGAEVTIKSVVSSGLEILGSDVSRLAIDEGAEGVVSLRIKAKPQLGEASLTVYVTHKEERAQRSASVSIRPVTPYRTRLDSGYQTQDTLHLPVEHTLHKALASQSVAASASPLVIVDGLTDYLANFPHGCTEQVVSKVFPLVGLMSHPAYAPHVPQVNTFFTHLIGKLRQRQLSNGGFVYWPGHTEAAEYPSIYVLHFLIEASERGYPVPQDMLQQGKQYLVGYVGRSSHTIIEARNRAIAIYLLTRMGQVTTNYLVDVEEGLTQLDSTAWQGDILVAYLAATYQLLQQDTAAQRLVEMYSLGDYHSHQHSDFFSPATVDAQYVYLLSTHFPNQARALNRDALLALTRPIFKGQYNTISAAYSVLALGAYSQLTLDSQVNEAITFVATNAKGEMRTLPQTSTPFASANYPVGTQQVTLTSGTPLFYMNTQMGFDQSPPQSAISEGLEIHRDFVDSEGNVVTAFQQGEELTVRLRVRGLAPHRLTNIAVIDLLPGGFEVIRSSVSRKSSGWQADYIDVREDRVVFYGGFDAGLSQLTYKVKLTASGVFTIPPSYAESMYDRSVRAMSTANTFTVRDDVP